eukprot:scaffold471229_cov14-Prasinocladus_malaysianus.AAC.1
MSSCFLLRACPWPVPHGHDPKQKNNTRTDIHPSMNLIQRSPIIPSEQVKYVSYGGARLDGRICP